MALTENAIAAAKSSHSLLRTSPLFVANDKIKFVKYDYVPFDNDDNKGYAVFVTDTDATIAVASLLRTIPIKPVTNPDGQVVTTAKPNGTFTAALLKLISANKFANNDAFLSAVKDSTDPRFFNVQLVVKNVRTVTIVGRYGDAVRTIYDIDFA